MSDTRYLIKLLVDALSKTGAEAELCANARQWLKAEKGEVVSTDKFAGHTPVTVEDANSYCRILSALGMEEEGNPVAAVSELLAENERLNARINSLGDELEMMAYKWGDAEKDNETLRNRVAELEELATDAYLIARVEP